MKLYLNALSEGNIKNIYCFFSGLLIFLYPVVVLSTKGWGTALFFLLTFAGLSHLLLRDLYIEKKMLFLFAGYFSFVFVALLSFLHTNDLSAGFNQLELLVRLLFVSVILIPIKYNIKCIWRYFVAGLICSGFVILFIVIFQMVWEGSSHVNGAYQRIEFGNISAIISVLLFLILVESDEVKPNKSLCGLSIICALSGVLFSGSRGAWLVVSIIFIYFYFKYYFLKRYSYKHKILSTIVLIFLFIAVALSPAMTIVKFRLNHLKSDVENYITNPNSSSSLGDRFNMWEDSIKIISKSPVLGTGVGDFAYDEKIMIQSGVSKSTWVFSNAHSIYFNTIATMGVSGIVIMLMSIYIIPWLLISYKRERNAPLGKIGEVCCRYTLFMFFFFGFTIDWLSSGVLLNTYILLISLFFAMTTRLRLYSN